MEFIIPIPTSPSCSSKWWDSVISKTRFSQTLEPPASCPTTLTSLRTAGQRKDRSKWEMVPCSSTSWLVIWWDDDGNCVGTANEWKYLFRGGGLLLRADNDITVGTFYLQNGCMSHTWERWYQTRSMPVTVFDNKLCMVVMNVLEGEYGLY